MYHKSIPYPKLIVLHLVFCDKCNHSDTFEERNILGMQQLRNATTNVAKVPVHFATQLDLYWLSKKRETKN